MNKYTTETRLRDIKVVIEYNDELIPGIAISQTETFGINQISNILPELIEEERELIKTKILDFVGERHAERKVLYADGNSRNVAFLEVDADKKIIGVDERNVLDKNHWYVNSGTFFVETEVSSQPATEKYIDDARNAEILLQKANVKRTEAEAKAVEEGSFFIPQSSKDITINVNHKLGIEEE